MTSIKELTPKEQAAFDNGRKLGQAEGLILYHKHIQENISKDKEKLLKKLNIAKSDCLNK